MLITDATNTFLFRPHAVLCAVNDAVDEPLGKDNDGGVGGVDPTGLLAHVCDGSLYLIVQGRHDACHVTPVATQHVPDSFNTGVGTTWHAL